MKTFFDYCILGSGAAGLSLAIKLADRFHDRSVVIVTKGEPDESSTRHAQGGVAVVADNVRDSFAKHVEDTLKAGAGLCDRAVVEMVVNQAPDCIDELMSMGVDFDQNESGTLDLGLEGGHSANRVVHHKDSTGKEIELSLLRKAHSLKNITILSSHMAIDLVTDDSTKQGSCVGVVLLDERSGSVKNLRSSFTCIATGGCGEVYQQTTNPSVATGDGVAMAFRAGAKIKNMEFIQFHPTALQLNNDRIFLISEALRGFGAQLRNDRGERFMFKYSEMAELAPRDIVARAIHFELGKSNTAAVFLDCTHLDASQVKEKFPNIHAVCEAQNIDLSEDWIPVVPAAHYQCGGVEVDKNGQTSIDRLYACGECTYTGLHGANRLASNAILEALVFANNIYQSLLEQNLDDKTGESAFTDHISSEKIIDLDVLAIRTKLKKLMSADVAIVRTKAGLTDALRWIEEWGSIIEQCSGNQAINRDLLELKNMLDTSKVIVEQSLARTYNCGGFYNPDLEPSSDMQIEEFQ